MHDTMDALRIKEPLPVGNFGSIFWSRSSKSGKSPDSFPGPDNLPDFEDFLNQLWTVHYSIPQYGGLTLDLQLPAPLRTEGFENVDISIDWLTGIIERSYTRDWDQQAQITDLSIPRPLIERLEKLLREWQGKRLMIHYCCLPEEGDPTIIWAEFSGCHRLPINPDETLQYIAENLSEVLAN